MTLYIPRRYEIVHVIKQDISKVWNFIIDYTAWNTLIRDIVSKNKFIKGDNTFTPSNEFSHIWYGVGELHHKCVAIEEKQMEKFGSWQIYAEVLGITYHQNFYLYRNTVEDHTLFKWEIIYGEYENVAFTTEIIEGYKQLIKNIMTLMEKHLTTKINKCVQLESVMIQADSQKVWSLITNWSKLRTVAPIVADRVEVDSDELKIGLKINLGFKRKKKINFCSLQVVDVVNKNSRRSYTMTCYNKELQIPRQEVVFMCVKIRDDLSFLTFQHRFIECIDVNFIENLSKNKREILGKVKKYLEEV